MMMMLVACTNQLLTLYAGALLLTSAVQLEYFGGGGGGAGGGGGKALPDAVRGWWHAPWAGAPLLLLSLLAAAGTTARAPLARALLAVYGVLCMVSCLCVCAAAAWAGVALGDWLQGEGASRELGRSAALRAWLRPLLPLLAPKHISTMFADAEVQAEVVGVLCAGAALPLVLLAAGAAALCARPAPQRTEPTYGSSRSDSLHYESTSLYKVPLHDSSVWQ